MAIHPIDLSTVYTQLDNVAKLTPASQNQNQQLAFSLTIAQESQKSQLAEEGVKELNESSESTSTKITDEKNSSGESSFYGKKNDKKEKDEEKEDSAPVRKKISEPNLGNHIDITG